MQLQSFELDKPKPNEVSISVRAIGLNFADVFAIWGLYGATPKGSFTPGLEFAGIVEETGSEVKKCKTWRQGHGCFPFWRLHHPHQH